MIKVTYTIRNTEKAHPFVIQEGERLFADTISGNKECDKYLNDLFVLKMNLHKQYTGARSVSPFKKSGSGIGSVFHPKLGSVEIPQYRHNMDWIAPYSLDVVITHI